jgi:cathepsin D
LIRGARSHLLTDIVNEITGQTINGSTAGIMGFAWPSIAQSKAQPFWKAVIDSGRASSPEFGLFITRYQDDLSARDEEYGGSLTFGGVNSSLFTGDIEYLNLTDPGSELDFWALNIASKCITPAWYLCGSSLYC